MEKKKMGFIWETCWAPIYDNNSWFWSEGTRQQKKQLQQTQILHRDVKYVTFKFDTDEKPVLSISFLTDHS